MKKFTHIPLLILAFVGLVGCQFSTQVQESSTEGKSIESTGTFGEAVMAEGALPAAELVGLFVDSDSVSAKLSGHILASCKHSGCWMDVDMGGQDAVHVTFKDEAFTIPLDAAGKNAVVQGIAYREIIPVETLRDYAREEGKSEEEIEAITEPAWEYEIVATGVIIEE